LKEGYESHMARVDHRGVLEKKSKSGFVEIVTSPQLILPRYLIYVTRSQSPSIVSSKRKVRKHERRPTDLLQEEAIDTSGIISFHKTKITHLRV